MHAYTVRLFAREIPVTESTPERRELTLSLRLTAVVSLRVLGLFLIMPVFMVLAAERDGFTPLLGGLAVGVYGLTQALLQQPFGALSDRWGRRRVILLGLTLFTVGGVLAALAESMALLIAGRALQGCGAIAGVALAFAADATAPERRSRAMALIGIGIGFAFLLSTVLAVPLANLLGLEGLFWLTAVLGIVGIVLTPSEKTSTPRAHVVHDDGPIHGLWPLVLSVFFLHAAMTMIFVVLPGLLIERYGLVLSRHWVIYVPAMVVSALALFPVLRALSGRGWERAALPSVFGTMGVSVLALAAPVSLPVIIAVAVAYFLAFNVLEAALPAEVSRLAPNAKRGRTMGRYTMSQFFGAFVGGVSGGALVEWAGATAALNIAGGFSLAWAALLWALWRAARRPSDEGSV